MKVHGKEDFATGYLVLDILWIFAYGAGLVFLIVDFASGSIWHPSPSVVDFVLERDPNAELAQARANDSGRDRLLGPQPPSGPPQPQPQRPPGQEPGRDRLLGPQPQRPPADGQPSGAAQPGAQPGAAQPGAQTQGGQPAGQEPPPSRTPPPPPAPTPTGKAASPPIEPKRIPPRASTEVPPAEPVPLPGRTVVLAIGPSGKGTASMLQVCSTLGKGRDSRRLVGPEATRIEVLRAVRDHLERGVGPDDRAVLYFTGDVLRGEDGEVYLGTADTDPARLPETALSTVTLSSYLERIEAAMLLVLVDTQDGAGTDEVAGLLAESGALTVVARGRVAGAVTRALGPGAADVNRDAVVSSGELSRWLVQELGQGGAVRGAERGALPVLR